MEFEPELSKTGAVLLAANALPSFENIPKGTSLSNAQLTALKLHNDFLSASVFVASCYDATRTVRCNALGKGASDARHAHAAVLLDDDVPYPGPGLW